MAIARARGRALRRTGRRAQRGMVMIITLVVLVLLLVGVAAMVRSADTSSILVGNLAFRRDLTNRAESAIRMARAQFASGPLGNDAARMADNADAHYSASRLAGADGGTTGIPAILVSDSAYAARYPDVTSVDGITLRWVIDRQCLVAPGTPAAFRSDVCENVYSAGDPGGSSHLRKPDGGSRPLYRISVRVSGPHGTEAYFQSTFVN